MTDKKGRKPKKPRTRVKPDDLQGRVRPEHLIKLKIRRLARLVDGFLENTFDREELMLNPDRIEGLRTLLEENLWCGEMDPHDPDWDFESGLFDPDNPDLYDHETIMKADNEAGADAILYFHGLLKNGFWEGFKEEVLHHNETVEARERIKNLDDAKSELDEISAKIEIQGLEGQYLDAIHMKTLTSIHLEMPPKINIPCDLEAGVVRFPYNGIDAIQALVNLIQGLPIDVFGKCNECQRSFILTSKHKRQFCTRLCAARYGARKTRAEDPEGYRAYHRGYYRDRKLKT